MTDCRWGWLAVLAVTGCAEPEPRAAPADPANSAGAVLPAQSAPRPAAQPAAAVPLLVLAPDGLSLMDPSSGSSRLLPFGTPAEVLTPALARVQGRPSEQGTNAECGAGPLAFLRWENGLTLWLADGRFAGWAVAEDGDRRLTTASGLGIGSTRAELDAALAAEVAESSLGTEFSAGALGGLLGGDSQAAQVEALWAGTTCHFR